MTRTLIFFDLINEDVSLLEKNITSVTNIVNKEIFIGVIKITYTHELANKYKRL